MKDGGNWLALQLVLALGLLLGMPLGLLLRAAQPQWLDRAASLASSRRTACLLAGAAAFLLALAVVAVANSHRPFQVVAVLAMAGSSALLASGFAAGAWAQGRSLLGRDGGAAPLVCGWLARAGLVAVPLVGYVFAAYLVALSLGTPVVAWLSRSGKATTEPSSGSTPES